MKQSSHLSARACALSVFLALCLSYALVFYQAEVVPLDSPGSIKGLFQFLTTSFLTTRTQMPALAFAASLWFVRTLRSKLPFSKTAIVAGAVGGFICVTGQNCLMNDGFAYLVEGKLPALVLSALAWVGFGVAYAGVFELFFRQVDRTSTQTAPDKTLRWRLFDRRPFVSCTLCILACWFPYCLAFFPGLLHYDNLVALNMYYRLRNWTVQFPPFCVVLSGICMKIGKLFGSDNLGCLLYVLPQFLLLLTALGFTFVLLHRWQTPYWLRWTALALFALCPFFPMYAIHFWKDTYYGVAFLWLLILMILYREDAPRRAYPLLMIPMVFLFCSIRRDGRFVMLFVLLLLLLLRKRFCKNWKPLIAALLAGVVLSTGVNKLLVAHYNIKPASIRGSLSIPIQQTARYMLYYRDEITQEEWEVLEDVFINPELAEVYEPGRADKPLHRLEHFPTAEQYRAYLKLWTAQFFKHPGTYFSAAYNKIYGYLYLDKTEFYGRGFATHNPTEETTGFFGNIVITNPEATAGLRSVLISGTTLWLNLPIIKLTSHPSFYIWVALAAAGLLFRYRRFDRLVFFAPALGVFGICCLSPLNGSARYSFSIMASCALLMAYAIRPETQAAQQTAPPERV